jgi:hypothetical protein
MKDRDTLEKGSIFAECKRGVQNPAAQLMGARAELPPASARDQWC